MVDLGENVLKGSFYISGVESRCFNEGERVLLRELFSFLSGYSPQMSQVTLVAYQHDHNIGVCMIPQLLQPPLYILIS